MSIREGINRKVSFDTRDELGVKIDKLTVMLGRLAAKDNNEKRLFKPQIYQGRGRGQNRSFSQGNYQDRNRSNNRSSSRDRGQFRDRPGLGRITEEAIFEVTLGDMVDKTAEGNIVLCKAVLTLVHNCYLFLYMKCLGGLHYNSLYALSLHSATSSSLGSLFFAC